MRDLLNHIFTGKDNATIDIGRILWFEAIQAFIVFTLVSVFRGQNLDLISWATAMSTLLVFGAVNLRVKAAVEPEECEPTHSVTHTHIEKDHVEVCGK